MRNTYFDRIDKLFSSVLCHDSDRAATSIAGIASLSAEAHRGFHDRIPQRLKPQSFFMCSRTRIAPFPPQPLDFSRIISGSMQPSSLVCPGTHRKHSLEQFSRCTFAQQRQDRTRTHGFRKPPQDPDQCIGPVTNPYRTEGAANGRFIVGREEIAIGASHVVISAGCAPLRDTPPFVACAFEKLRKNDIQRTAADGAAVKLVGHGLQNPRGWHRPSSQRSGREMGLTETSTTSTRQARS